MDDDLDYYNENNDEEEVEETDSNGGGWFWGIVIGIVIASLVWGIGKNGKYEGQTAEEWFNDYDYQVSLTDDLEEKIQNYQAALEEANNNIERAKRDAWSSYDEMGNALDDLNTVSEP